MKTQIEVFWKCISTPELLAFQSRVNNRNFFSKSELFIYNPLDDYKSLPPQFEYLFFSICYHRNDWKRKLAWHLVKKALITPLRDKWDVKVKDGPDLDVQGDILDHEYSIKHGWNKVAEVSKKWFSLTDTYGVEIDPGQNDILILAIAIAIDMMAHDDDKKDKRDE